MRSRLPAKLALGVAAGVAAGGALSALAWAAGQPDSQLLGRTLVAGDDPEEIALTYDDGPNTRSTPALLDVLARHNARATFFMIGNFAQRRAEIVRAVHNAGHLIGNHTMTHPFLPSKSERVIRDELRGCNEVLEDILGAPVRYVRAPFGGRRPAVLRIARELGLTPVQWNVQGNDWEPIGVDGIVAKVNNGLARSRRKGRGANILLHDGFDEVMDFDRSDTVNATDRLLTAEKANGLRTVTVDAWG